MNYKDDPLWQRIADYTFDDPNAAFPFSKKLAKEQNWSVAFTQKAIAEYCRFMYLCCISPDGASPSTIIDEVWHLHLTYTVDYWQRFCRHVLQKDIHHHPSAGGDEQKAKHTNWYAGTLDLYTNTFAESPPNDIWYPINAPASTIPLSESANQVSFFEAGSYLRFLILLVPFPVVGLVFGQFNPFALSGMHFLVFYALLALSSLLVMWLGFRAQEAILVSRLTELNPIPPATLELAFLAGGEKRVALFILSKLVNEDVLVPVDNRWYSIDRDRIESYNGPLKEDLISNSTGEINFNDLVKMCAKEAYPYYEKYRALKNDFENKQNNIVTPVVVGILGVARLVQGLGNDKPVSYLIFLMFAYYFIVSTLMKQFKFYESCRKILINEDVLNVAEVNDFNKQVIFNGLQALVGVSIFTNLRNRFPDHSSGLDGSGCSGAGGSGSCSSGGSCGGGGGCGGCGGD